MRRMGQVLEAVEPVNVARDRKDGSDLPLSRKAAAQNAGISERQQKTAMRVAAIPEDQFEAQTKHADRQPTVTARASFSEMNKGAPLRMERRAPTLIAVAAASEGLNLAKLEIVYFQSLGFLSSNPTLDFIKRPTVNEAICDCWVNGSTGGRVNDGVKTKVNSIYISCPAL